MTTRPPDWPRHEPAWGAWWGCSRATRRRILARIARGGVVHDDWGWYKARRLIMESPNSCDCPSCADVRFP